MQPSVKCTNEVIQCHYFKCGKCQRTQLACCGYLTVNLPNAINKIIADITENYLAELERRNGGSDYRKKLLLEYSAEFIHIKKNLADSRAEIDFAFFAEYLAKFNSLKDQYISFIRHGPDNGGVVRSV